MNLTYGDASVRHSVLDGHQPGIDRTFEALPAELHAAGRKLLAEWADRVGTYDVDSSCERRQVRRPGRQESGGAGRVEAAEERLRHPHERGDDYDAADQVGDEQVLYDWKIYNAIIDLCAECAFEEQPRQKRHCPKPQQ